jgi:hypothetical protein
MTMITDEPDNHAEFKYFVVKIFFGLPAI